MKRVSNARKCLRELDNYTIVAKIRNTIIKLYGFGMENVVYFFAPPRFAFFGREIIATFVYDFPPEFRPYRILDKA